MAGRLAVQGRLYLDTNILIYFVEGHPTFSHVLSTLFDAIESGRIEAVTSELTLAEVLVKPLAEGRSAVADVYRQMFDPAAKIKALPIERPTLLLSAEIRARHGGRAFDAIHVASAIRSECRCLSTEDTGMRVPGPLRVVRIVELTQEEDRSDHG